MKNWLLATLTLTVVCAGESNAQFVKRYGLKVAVTSADQQYELKYFPEMQTERRIGWCIAGFLEMFDAPVFSLMTQIEYSQRGMGQEFVLTGPDPEPVGVTILYSRLDYLSIPILAKARFQTQTVSPYVVAGPRLDYLLGYTSDEDAFNSVYDNFNKIGVGGSVGFGIQTETI